MAKRKMLFINGSPKNDGCVFTAMNAVAEELSLHDVETEFLWLGTGPVQDCLECRKCGAMGKCVIDNDAVNRVLERMDEFDGIVLGSPVYYAGASGRLCSFLDRLFYAGGAKLYGKIGAAVVNCRRAGNISALERLNLFFSISNMIVPGSSYWNETHGRTPEDVRNDEEGMQTMRTLGKNIAWLIDNLEAGSKANVPAPEYEKKIKTNFIR